MSLKFTLDPGRPAALTLFAFTAALAPACAFAAPADDHGRLILDSRLRYENVDQSGLASQANALTLRTRIGWESPKVADLRLLVEAESVVAPVRRYADGVTPRPGYPVVPDPETIELNRAQITWTGLAHAEVTAGRQRLILGNARFVGNAGWRQNEQTFDAVKLVARPIAPLTLTYVFVGQVQRVLGNESPMGQWHGRSHLIQGEVETPAGHLSAYDLLLDFANAPTQSSQTYGVRLSGAHKLAGPVAVTYELEYARQDDYGNNPASFGLGYALASAGVKAGDASLALVYERLGGNGTRGFQTPLASLHAFQGWADMLTVTPASGVRDLYLRAGVTVKPGASLPSLKLRAEAHDFGAADGSPRIGRELDLAVQAPLTPRLSAELSAAVFDGARAPFPDTRKLWLTLACNF